LYTKRESVDRTLSRCRRMLQESPSEEQSSVDVDIRLTLIREQFDALCQRSDRRSISICVVSTLFAVYIVYLALLWHYIAC